jgi:hypothetical protein
MEVEQLVAAMDWAVRLFAALGEHRLKWGIVA